MKHSRAVFIPAILVAAASLCLILYSLFGAPSGEGDGGGSKEIFKMLGTTSVFCAAASYAWLRLKKKRKSVSPFVRRLVRWFDKLHQLTGYAAIILIAVHGFYFLTQAAAKEETYTGIAGFVLLLALGVYGFLIRRVPNKYIRKIHFLLATGFAVAAIIHGGGSAIMAALSVVVFWGIVWQLERMAKPSEKQSHA